MESDGERTERPEAETDMEGNRMRGNAKRFILGTLVLPRSPSPCKAGEPKRANPCAIFDPPHFPVSVFALLSLQPPPRLLFSPLPKIPFLASS